MRPIASSSLFNTVFQTYLLVSFPRIPRSCRSFRVYSRRVSRQGDPVPFHVDLQMEDGCTPLHVATCGGHTTVTKQLIEVRCNVDVQMNHGHTPLHYAAYGGHESVTKQHLAARCNVHLQTNDGATALQVLRARGTPELTR